MVLRSLTRWGSIFWLLLAANALRAANKEIVLIAGSPSHGVREHEFRAGCLLLGDCLNQMPGVHATIASNGWPQDPSILEKADAIFVYCDGGDAHPAIKPDRMKLLDGLAAKGVGIGMAHYAVEVPHGVPGLAMLRWTGGFYETYWSVNPTWKASFTQLPQHPVTRGVKPFAIEDEWYYHMLFTPYMQGVTPILTAIPTPNTVGGDDAHGGNPWARAAAAKGDPQHVMWVQDRANNGRGFGFTGGHYHENWGNDDFRKLVLNAILWIAHADIPENGAASSVTPEALKANLDPK
ncbi:MAG TPA: ThuA domain-containing protein [Candidatus Limnocylindria bacterium]|nr:ThuA domain-containing protein [Candidatus Limnocylindria bacterium]